MTLTLKTYVKIQDSIYLPLTRLNARIISSYTEEKKKKKENVPSKSNPNIALLCSV